MTHCSYKSKSESQTPAETIPCCWGAEPYAVIDADHAGEGLFEEVACVWHAGTVAWAVAPGQGGGVRACGDKGGDSRIASKGCV